MFVLIVGGGVVGASLAEALLDDGHEVTVVERDRSRYDALRSALPQASVVHGDGDEPVVLESAQVSRAPIVAAMTDEDEDNLVACLLARREYGAAATYARVNDPANAWLFGPRFGVDTAIPKSDLDAAALATIMTQQRQPE